jgi:hypothetical protein
MKKLRGLNTGCNQLKAIARDIHKKCCMRSDYGVVHTCVAPIWPINLSLLLDAQYKNKRVHAIDSRLGLCKQVRTQINADLWLSGATHPHTWKKIKNKGEKELFLKSKMIRYYTCILYFPRKLLFIVTWAKKQNYDEYKVNSTWS